MSAAVAAPRPAEPTKRQMERGFCRVPPRFFLTIPKSLTHTEFLLLGLILDRTVGWSRDRGYITIETFAEVAKVSRKFVLESLDRLHELGYVVWRTGCAVDDRWYSLAPELIPAEEPAGIATGKCGACGAIGEVEIEPAGFVRVPHSFFWDLARSLEYAELRVVAALLVATVGQRKPTERAEVTIQELEVATGLARRTVQDALASCEERGVIASDQPDRSQRPEAGRAITYWVCPENFRGLQARAVRTLNRERRGETQAKEPAEEQAETPDNPESPRADECQTRKEFARCRSCGQIAMCEILDAPAQPSAGAPGRKSPAREVAQPPPREIEGLEAYLWRWSSVLGPVKPSDVREIAEALGAASLPDFAARVERRRAYILRQGQSYRVLVSIARDCSQVAAREGRQAAVAARQPTREEQVDAFVLDLEFAFHPNWSEHIQRIEFMRLARQRIQAEPELYREAARQFRELYPEVSLEE